MSRDDKIRDLMRRLVAMSPEPPPYPEEVTMARTQPAANRPHPALVVAVTVAAVTALAVPLFLFLGGGGGDPIAATTTTTVTPSTTSTTVDTTSTTQATSTTVVEGTTWSGIAFLYAEPDASFAGNPALVPVSLEVTAAPGTFSDHSEFTQALAALAASGTSLPPGLGNAIPSDVIVVDQSVEGGLVRAEMSQAFLEGAGGLLADLTMLNQLVYTLTIDIPEAGVVFTVDRQPVEAFGSEGLDLTEPVGRDDYLDELHVINLTQPVTDTGQDYLVEGIANVFEATLNVAVLDGEGAVVHEEVVTATCGTGCWGEFSTAIDASYVVPGESSIRVFTYSAEDGSVVDAITIPIPEDGTWRLVAG